MDKVYSQGKVQAQNQGESDNKDEVTVEEERGEDIGQNKKSNQN